MIYDYMEHAKQVAEHSPCVRAKVGAVIINPKKIHLGIDAIISTGFNDNPSGVCECNNGLTKDDTIHAEITAFNNIQNSIMLNGSWIYINRRPCFNCSLKIFNNNIKRVVYEPCGNMKGIQFLEKHKIECIEYNEYLKVNIFN